MHKEWKETGGLRACPQEKFLRPHHLEHQKTLYRKHLVVCKLFFSSTSVLKGES